jgi:hypothetical protein
VKPPAVPEVGRGVRPPCRALCAVDPADLSERAVLDIMGWPRAKMTLVYQHITDSVRKDVADKVGSFLWGTSEVAARFLGGCLDLREPSGCPSPFAIVSTRPRRTAPAAPD